jgi:hypothetical protein
MLQCRLRACNTRLASGKICRRTHCAISGAVFAPLQRLPAALFLTNHAGNQDGVVVCSGSEHNRDDVIISVLRGGLESLCVFVCFEPVFSNRGTPLTCDRPTEPHAHNQPQSLRTPHYNLAKKHQIDSRHTGIGSHLVNAFKQGPHTSSE